MQIHKISTNNSFKNQPEQKKRHEFIDTLSEKVTNPRDVNDCVAVPRGIFKAYMFIMAGFAVLSTGFALPQKWKTAKLCCSIIGNGLNLTSALFFAKPFFIKQLSPTVKREDINNKTTN